MTREELLSNWAEASANERFLNFFSWIVARLAGIDDLLPPLSIARNQSTAHAERLGEASFSVNPDYFLAKRPELAVETADIIVAALEQLAEDNLAREREARKKRQEEAKNRQAMCWDKGTADSKPKAQIIAIVRSAAKPVDRS